ncbi:MAG TPA: glycosyltransferase family 9 protein [Burkholderiales bacterium]|nr:glycosyltransferase family 9 protein [Burkholderiales bacterium]
MSSPAKVLVVRNDRLGDFMLAFPTFLLLKRALPDTAIHALVPAYTREMALCCAGIDAIELDPGPQAPAAEQFALLRRLRQARYDAVLTLFSTTRIGWLTAAARIPYRLAPATKIAQLFYNRRLTQRRSQSAKPEFIYNLDLGMKLLADHGIADPAPPNPPYLRFAETDVATVRSEFCRTRGIAPSDRLIFIHPGSGGSANNLSVYQYARLVQSLRAAKPATFVITAGPGEEANAARLEMLTEGLSRTVYHSRQGLRRFAEHIQFADLFISGSTGPLHIAGALDRPTAAFYTRRRSATSLRWQTLNRPERRLAFSPPDTAAEEDMSAVDVVAAAAKINEKFL